MKAEGMGASEIAKALKIGRASVYRALEGGRRSLLSPCEILDVPPHGRAPVAVK